MPPKSSYAYLLSFDLRIPIFYEEMVSMIFKYFLALKSYFFYFLQMASFLCCQHKPVQNHLSDLMKSSTSLGLTIDLDKIKVMVLRKGGHNASYFGLEMSTVFF